VVGDPRSAVEVGQAEWASLGQYPHPRTRIPTSATWPAGFLAWKHAVMTELTGQQIADERLRGWPYLPATNAAVTVADTNRRRS
jgi:hypothetical protein